MLYVTRFILPTNPKPSEIDSQPRNLYERTKHELGNTCQCFVLNDMIHFCGNEFALKPLLTKIKEVEETPEEPKL